ncbi:MAG: MotA/TolQ/ExbB proton channel family protein [Candidimonas sp.]
MSIILSMACMAYLNGVFDFIITYDSSLISVAILTIYTGTEIYASYQSWFISRQIDKIKNNQNYYLKNSNIEIIKQMVFSRVHYVRFMASMLTMLGLFGTIYGLIMIFMPYFSGQDTNDIKMILEYLFSNIGVASITTAVGLICSMLLRINAESLNAGCNEFIREIISTR